MDDMIITREGLRRLSDELERLKVDGRRSVAERIALAVATESNRDENAEFQEARTEQALLEQRIATLEERVRSAMLVEPRLGNGRVDVGERVRVRDLATGERLDLELVGPFEADPFAGRISIASPVGKAIVGLRRGQIADVEAPRGRRQYKVLAVEPARAG
jgi:transcription elongation factor GreA